MINLKPGMKISFVYYGGSTPNGGRNRKAVVKEVYSDRFFAEEVEVPNSIGASHSKCFLNCNCHELEVLEEGSDKNVISIFDLRDELKKLVDKVEAESVVCAYEDFMFELDNNFVKIDYSPCTGTCKVIRKEPKNEIVDACSVTFKNKSGEIRSFEFLPDENPENTLKEINNFLNQ